MEREYSAVDAVYMILDKIEAMEKKLLAIDDNIKILNNKITKINKTTSSVVQEVQKVMPMAMTTSQPTLQENSVINNSKSEPEKLLLGPTKVYGLIINKMKEPIKDVIINIFDSNNILVKSTKTNIDGGWDVRLPPGRFNIEYIHSKFKPINKDIEVPKNVKEFEVK